MRYEKGRKDATRKHIIQIASQNFREQGIDALSVANLMSSAGLTHGGFYNHFSSKEELVEAALCASLDASQDWLKENTDGSLQSFLDLYLTEQHRENPGHGCVLTCLSGEIARRQDSTLTAFNQKLDEYIAYISSFLPETVKEKDRIDTATKLLAAVVGTLQLSRLFDDKKQIRTVLENGKAAAFKIVV